LVTPGLRRTRNSLVPGFKVGSRNWPRSTKNCAVCSPLNSDSVSRRWLRRPLPSGGLCRAPAGRKQHRDVPPTATLRPSSEKPIRPRVC